MRVGREGERGERVMDGYGGHLSYYFSLYLYLFFPLLPLPYFSFVLKPVGEELYILLLTYIHNLFLSPSFYSLLFSILFSVLILRNRSPRLIFYILYFSSHFS
jgi:hypothetical protein